MFVRSSRRRSQLPFSVLSRPFVINRQRCAQPVRLAASAVISIPSRNTSRAAGINRGTLVISMPCGICPSGAGGPMGPSSASASVRSLTCRAISRALVHARTIPATEFSSAIAMADRPVRAARSIYSSGWEAPVRKVKFDVILSSANMGSDQDQKTNRDTARPLCSTFVLFRRGALPRLCRKLPPRHSPWVFHCPQSG